MYDISQKYKFLSGAYHLTYYIPRNTGHLDQISEGLLSFKDGVPDMVRFWCDKAIQEVGNIFNPSFIVRALSSSELTVIPTSPLDQLGRCLAAHLNSMYLPELLWKSSTNPQLKKLNRQDRHRVIHGLYTASQIEITGKIEILIIDDIITTGSTVREIFRALSQTYPGASIKFLSLAKTKNDKFIDSPVKIEVPPPNPPIQIESLSKIERYHAARMGMSPEQMINIRAKHFNFGASWDGTEIRELVKLAAEGNTIESIAAKMGRTTNSISMKIRETAFGRNNAKRFEIIGNKIPEPMREYWASQIQKGANMFIFPPPDESGCFIATAVYGSDKHPYVLEFRRFRNDRLSNSSLGRSFISFYYSYSPSFVPIVKRSRVLRVILDRLFLLPIYLYIRMKRGK